MSLQNAKAFIEKVEKDPTFRATLLKIKTPHEKKKILEQNHFHFSDQEYKNAFQERFRHPLNEMELTKIAGGKPSREMPHITPQIATAIANVANVAHNE